MHKPYSKRKATPRLDIIYSIDELTRRRIFAVLEEHIGPGDRFFREMQGKLMREYGYLDVSAYRAARVSDDPAIDHFFRCPDDHVMDFIEFAFRCTTFDNVQEGVDAVNSVFEDANVGYRFSDHIAEKSQSIRFGKKKTQAPARFPEAHKITDSGAYESIVHPTLTFLAAPEFEVARDEMMKALAAERQGQAEDAITLACASYESVIKTVLSIKGLPFDKDKDTCRVLIKRCIDASILPAFYESCFVSPATIRNRLGDAHGRGPAKQYAPDRIHAEHIIHLVSTNILLLKDIADI